jgi:hypothetical protein
LEPAVEELMKLIFDDDMFANTMMSLNLGNLFLCNFQFLICLNDCDNPAIILIKMITAMRPTPRVLMKNE